jgi:hypothetical protein
MQCKVVPTNALEDEAPYERRENKESLTGGLGSQPDSAPNFWYPFRAHRIKTPKPRVETLG